MRTLAACLLLLASTQAAAQCPPADLNGDWQITISEVIAVVNLALNGCQPPSPRFQVNPDGTVLDRHTFLLWEACGDRKVFYPDALARADLFNQERRMGKRNWRVPTRQEWLLLGGAGWPGNFPECPEDLYWTSDEDDVFGDAYYRVQVERDGIAVWDTAPPSHPIISRTDVMLVAGP